MYLWPLIGRLWVLLPIFLPQTTNANIGKDLFCSEMEMNGRNSDDQAEDVSGDFVLIDTYWVIPWVCLVY